MTYKFTFTEEEVAYIRRALCDFDMKHCLLAIEYEKTNTLYLAQVHEELQSMGHSLIHVIDKTKETQTA